MTIQFQGHIASTKTHINGMFAAELCCDHSVSGQESIVVYVPVAQVKEWAVGRCVSVTIYAFDLPPPESAP